MTEGEKYRISETDVLNILSSMPVPVIISTIENGTVVYVNRQFEDVLGYISEEMLGSTTRKLYTDHNDRKTLIKTFNDNGFLRNYEVSFRTKSGRIINVLACVEKIWIKGKSYILSALNDITDLTHIKESLYHSNIRFQKTFTANPAPTILTTMKEGRYLEVNNSWLRMLGYKRHEMINRTAFELCIWENPEERTRLIEKLEKHGHLKEEPIRIINKAGEARDTIWSAETIEHEGQDVMLSLFYDVTDLKEKNRELKRKESELKVKSKNLEELNAALKVLLKYREQDKRELEDTVIFNIKKQISPYLDLLHNSRLDDEQKSLMRLIETNLKEIVSPFLNTLASTHFDLTSRELQVSALIRNDKSTKEIAKILNISEKAVEFHRFRIRQKMGIANKKTTLKSYLSTLDYH